ncbi:DUF1549 and DUF1553 domain-containing protein [Methylocystis sp. JR02]|uniref:DUF1549 and DUF1553 domain-containing protein n=1 Tax=Methylocystis sp. JR02 TaxID=3046284 RepID=UPI0024BBB841|nr:DUF1549 and DUF1553 domain-containing protein [Methylocystis sp. JR02]MDJ0447255.1 DUF1549 and DUF1553 domain-containing protein [Methylocystis sp. JR02]
MKHPATKVGLALLLSVSTAALAIGADSKPLPDAAPVANAPTRAPHWAYQPIRIAGAPAVANGQWVRTPIDAFISSKIEAAKLTPSQDADRATFIRRATLDIWGLIPQPEEVAAFVNDESPDAYEKLVDRLLASPHYGERQARRWLDLARYADSSGFQNDITRPNFFRYRDWVVQSFNNDKPYSRFIQEQIAGDELAPGDQDALVATGFLASYADNPNARDLINRKYQIATDIVDTIGTAVLGTTIGCARCHDHKSDKLTQKDYFSLQAFFANTSFNAKFPAAKGAQEEEFLKAQAIYEAAAKDILERQKAIIESVRDKATQFYKERFNPDARASIVKAKSEWNALDRWVNYRAETVTDQTALSNYMRDIANDEKNPDRTPEIVAKWREYSKLNEELKKYEKLKPTRGSDTFTAATELGHPDAPATYVFFGGNHERPLDEVQPAFPEAISKEKPDIRPSATSSGRRTALANWLASPSNPLTARVLVNRVWNEYFGKGIVGTVSDFGKAGDKPTHPELLDYLADNFVKEGWSIKKLHRQILLSSVYRQSSTQRDEVAAADPENKLLASFPRKRLDAEQIRDSLLVAAGKLEDSLGGPAVFPPLPANLNVGPAWEASNDPRQTNRRSIYIFARRSVPYPLLETFDLNNTQQAHSKRDVTTTPLQALTLVNNDLVFQWSQALAGRVIREGGDDESARIDRLYQILFARHPDDYEKGVLKVFLDQHEKVIASKAAEGRFTIAEPTGKDVKISDPIRTSAFVDLVHTVANSNEFIYRF